MGATNPPWHGLNVHFILSTNPIYGHNINGIISWSSDASDFAIVIVIEMRNEYNQINFKTIHMNEVDYIQACDPLTVKIDVIKYEYLFEFTDVKHVITLSHASIGIL